MASLEVNQLEEMGVDSPICRNEYCDSAPGHHGSHCMDQRHTTDLETLTCHPERSMKFANANFTRSRRTPRLFALLLARSGILTVPRALS